MPSDYDNGGLNLEALRIGQRGAVSTIVNRVREREPYTAIVLPTRYGKTDVMRVAGMQLLYSGHISRALILVPNRVLARQCLLRHKWDEAVNRYGLPDLPGGISTYFAERAPRLPFPPQNAAFVAMTIQMASQNVSDLTHWVKEERKRYGVPPLIFVDESHTGKDDNTWGTCVKKLADAGAFVALLTATPYRSDEGFIHGFQIDRISTEPYKTWRHGVNGVDLFEGKRHIYRLVPHYSVSFQEAWAADNPPLLCKITRRPFDIVLERLHGETGDKVEERTLSLLGNESDVRAVLTNELRKHHVIRKACEILLEELRPRREDAPGSAAIVFVGNDRQGFDEDNRHALDVQSELKRLAPQLQVYIATSTDANADNTIEGFCNGQGDVLIVKQMGGVGLDVDRLKVCLDLSNIRTQTSFIQRLTRICTIWDRSKVTGNPWHIVRTATYITPDDVIGEGLFNKFIRDEGGVATEEDVQYAMTLESRTNSDARRPDVFEAKGVIEPETVQDSDQLEVSGSTLPTAERILNVFPELSNTRTKPGLIIGLREAGFDVGRPDLNGKDNTDSKSVPPPKIRNINEELDELRRDLNRLVGLLAQRTGGKYNPKNPIPYVSARKEAFNRHKRSVGISTVVELADITDLEALMQMRQNMQRELRGN
jgi:hypothetical protein